MERGAGRNAAEKKKAAFRGPPFFLELRAAWRGGSPSAENSGFVLKTVDDAAIFPRGGSKGRSPLPKELLKKVPIGLGA